jgi:hypothetical protein
VSRLLSGLCGLGVDKRLQDRLACLCFIHLMLLFLINVASFSKMLILHNIRCEFSLQTASYNSFDHTPLLDVIVALHAPPVIGLTSVMYYDIQ